VGPIGPSNGKGSTDVVSGQNGSVEPIGPVLFAYDGSDLAEFAIGEAGRQLATGRHALVLCVWQPVDVGFMPVTGRHFDADQASEVRKAAEETAEHGASLARQAGFQAQGATVQAAPTWKGIVKVAGEHQVSLIVVGSHRHGGIAGHFHGNVAAAVVAGGSFSVLVVHPQP
jgi:nucleotide-binding universal stress UspA family protein